MPSIHKILARFSPQYHVKTRRHTPVIPDSGTIDKESATGCPQLQTEFEAIGLHETPSKKLKCSKKIKCSKNLYLEKE